jgi:serine/threonine protein phosphatase PrpC
MKIALAAGEDLEKGVADLVDQANKNGGVDNITVILLKAYKDDEDAKK